MSKVEDILASTKVGDVLDAAKLNKFLKRQEEEEKKPSKFVIVFAVIGIVVAVAAAIYGIYRFFTPDYLDDFEDDFEDEFDNDFFEDEDEVAYAVEEVAVVCHHETRQRTNHCRKRENFQAV